MSDRDVLARLTNWMCLRLYRVFACLQPWDYDSTATANRCDYICTKKNARKSMGLHNPAAYTKIPDAFFFSSLSFSFFFSVSLRRARENICPCTPLKKNLSASIAPARLEGLEGVAVTLRHQTAGVARLLVDRINLRGEKAGPSGSEISVKNGIRKKSGNCAEGNGLAKIILICLSNGRNWNNTGNLERGGRGWTISVDRQRYLNTIAVPSTRAFNNTGRGKKKETLILRIYSTATVESAM